MLVGAGRSRLLLLSALAVIVFISFATFSYNPSLKADSAEYLRQWKQFSKDPHPPAWISQSVGKTLGKGSPETIPSTAIPKHDDLPSKNPNPFAAVDDMTGTPDSKSPLSDTAKAPKLGSAVDKPVLGGGAAKQPIEEQSGAAIAQPPPVVGLPPSKDSSLMLPSAGSSDEKAGYHQIFSRTSPDHNYFHVDFGTGWGYTYEAINPSILPHHKLNDTWIMVAQHYPRTRQYLSAWSAQIACAAKFQVNGNLSCVEPPSFLTIPPTSSPGHCNAKSDGVDLSPLTMNIGPHDARVFYGPRIPYILYGSQSKHTCFGQWIHDFRLTYDWGVTWNVSGPFPFQTEIQRPPPYQPVEKNWFVFWDHDEQPYAHYDTAPRRAFSRLHKDGSVGEDLATLSQSSDELCWKKHLELNPLQREKGMKSSIHQATNSLAVTFCERTDPRCSEQPDNTFIIQIYQHKIGNAFMHARYEPYVMVFKRTPPFEMVSISSKPIWISGRSSKFEMLYATSMNWRNNQTYQGYMDDVLHLNFGIEDKRTASIDVTAKDLLGDLMKC